MGVKISELPEATSVQESDIMPIVQEGVTKKVEMSKVGGNEVYIGDIEEAPDTAKLVIDDEGVPMFSSEVVNSLSGNETAKAPSVHAVKEALSYSTTEQVVGTWINDKPLYRMTIVFPNGTGTTSMTQYSLSDYGITNVDEIFLVDPSYYTLDQTASGIGFTTYRLNYNDGSDYSVQVGTLKLAITLGYIDIANSKLVITLEYTKTTD